jgi:hypothetical protein
MTTAHFLQEPLFLRPWPIVLVLFLLVRHFLFLDEKKVTKEKSRL